MNKTFYFMAIAWIAFCILVILLLPAKGQHDTEGFITAYFYLNELNETNKLTYIAGLMDSLLIVESQTNLNVASKLFDMNLEQISLLFITYLLAHPERHWEHAGLLFIDMLKEIPGSNMEDLSNVNKDVWI